MLRKTSSNILLCHSPFSPPKFNGSISREQIKKDCTNEDDEFKYDQLGTGKGSSSSPFHKTGTKRIPFLFAKCSFGLSNHTKLMRGKKLKRVRKSFSPLCFLRQGLMKQFYFNMTIGQQFSITIQFFASLR